MSGWRGLSRRSLEALVFRHERERHRFVVRPSAQVREMEQRLHGDDCDRDAEGFSKEPHVHADPGGIPECVEHAAQGFMLVLLDHGEDTGVQTVGFHAGGSSFDMVQMGEAVIGFLGERGLLPVVFTEMNRKSRRGALMSLRRGSSGASEGDTNPDGRT